jgi:hypothetical protein
VRQRITGSEGKVFNFEQTNPIQPLKLRLSYLFISAISSAGSGLLSFSALEAAGIATPRGQAKWGPTQLKRALEALPKSSGRGPTPTDNGTDGCAFRAAEAAQLG